MIRRDTPTVALVVPRGAPHYTGPVVRGAASVLRAARANVLTLVGGGHHLKGRVRNLAYELLSPDLVDGVITIGGMLFLEEGAAEHFREQYRNVEIVNVGSELPNSCNVSADNEQGMRDAVRHLAGLGHQKIALVRGPQHNTEATERYRGYRAGLESAGLTLDPQLIAPGTYMGLSGEKAVRLLIDERGTQPDAIIAANDGMALGVMRALKRRGLRIPNDVAVMGFDNLLDAATSDPPLTSIAQPLVDEGVRAAEVVLALARGQDAPERVLLPTELVIRESCGDAARSAPSDVLEPYRPGDEKAWFYVNANALFTTVRREAGWSGLERSVFLDIVRSVLAELEGEAPPAQPEALFQRAAHTDLWRWVIALSMFERLLVSALERAGLSTGTARARMERLVDAAERMAEAERASAIVEQEAALDRTTRFATALLSAHSQAEMLDAVAGRFSEHPHIRSYHVSLLEQDERWSRLALSSSPHSIEEAQPLRFITRTLPDTIRPQTLPYSLCVANLGQDRHAAGLLVLETAPEQAAYVDGLAVQMNSWLGARRGAQREAPTSEQEPRTPSGRAPARIGRYQVLSRLGSGGMATVYLAQSDVAGVARPVALKLLHTELEQAGWTEQLIEEARLAAAIRHPNVVQVLELGEHTSSVFLVMEFVEGGSLAVLMRAVRQSGKRFPTPIIARIVVDSLGGLHAAHELKDAEGVPLNLVHRDVSLQNILVGVNGVAKITDFGIAKTAEHFDVTESGVLKGKVRYMSPEQAFGRRVDRRADVWAMGVVLWELLTNRRLFGETNEAAALLKIISGPPPRVSTSRAVSPEVDDLVARALAVDPAERFQTAREFRSAISAAWQSEGGLAEAEEVGAFVRECLSHFEGGKHLILDSDTTLRSRRAN